MSLKDKYTDEVKQHAVKEGGDGQKFDYGKVPLDLLPTEALWEIGKVLKLGAEKYDPWNWKRGMAWSRLIGASMRHLFAWIQGEDKDQESGLSHLAHLGCCVLFLLTYELKKLGTDDRWKSKDNKE